MKKLWIFILGGITTALVGSASLIGQQTIPLPATALPGTVNTVACYYNSQYGTPVFYPCPSGPAFNPAVPGPIGGTTPSTGLFTTLNSATIETTKYADQFSGADIGSKANAAFAACSGANNCKVIIPSGSYSFSTQITVPQYSTLYCNSIDVGLTYTGTGTAIALSSTSGEVDNCRIDMGSGAGSVGIDMSGGSDIVNNVIFYNGSTTSTLIHDHSDKNRVNGIQVLGTPGTVVSCHNATDSEFSNLVTYGNVSNTTSIMLLMDSGCDGMLITDWTGSDSGLHGLLVRNTLTGGAPAWLFAKGFVSDFCTGGDCWDFDSTLAGSYLGFTFENSWAAAAGLNNSSVVVTTTANNVHISGGKGIWISGGSKIRAAAANGILIDNVNVGYVTIEGDEIASNNQAASTYNGITVSAMSYVGNSGYGGLTIANNTIGNLYGESGSGAQVYGVAFTQTNASDVTITGNNLDFNSTAPISNQIISPANYTIANNTPQTANPGPNSSTISLVEDFLGGSGATSSSIGQLGWSTQSIAGGAVNVGTGSSSGPNLGVESVISSTTINEGSALFLWAGSVIGSGYTFQQHWIASWNSVTNAAYRLGLWPNGTTAVIPTAGIYFRFDTSLSDTVIMACVSNSSTESCTSTGQTPSTSTFYDFYISTIASSGTISYQIGSNAPVTICSSGCTLSATVPTAVFAPFTESVSRSTSAVTESLDYMSLHITGLIR